MAFRYVNDAIKWIFLILWLGGNVATFTYTFWKYWACDEYYYLRAITGISIAFSRAAASALNLNLCLILLPVCRNLISLIRGSCLVGKTVIWRHLDKNITFHKLVGYTICFWTVVHYIGHTFNVERFIFAITLPDNSNDLRRRLSALPFDRDGSGINPVRSNHTNPLYQVMTIVPGYTGVIATLALILMVTSSTEFIRRNFFEIFWYTHHLFLIFFAAIIAHGFGGVVREQLNVDEHHYSVCRNETLNWNKIPHCPAPRFQPKDPETWMWVVGPLFLYLIERIIRFSRRFQKVNIVKVVQHPSQVIELRMQKRRFAMTAGQYIFINCPSISRFQWHPFTLTSAPEDDYFSVHMRVSGDWTESLAKAFHCDSTVAAGGSLDITQMPSLSVDGPFGTCSEDVFEYRVAVLVGAGIGVTPFASILRHLWYQHLEGPGESSRLKKVYFFWVCSDTKSFEWFVDILGSLEKKMEEKGSTHFIEATVYWTRGWNPEQRIELISSKNDPFDPITHLRSGKTQFGRPNWEEIFTSIETKHSSEKIGVFFCGPKEMSTQLHLVSDRHSSLSPNGTRFVYNKENF